MRHYDIEIYTSYRHRRTGELCEINALLENGVVELMDSQKRLFRRTAAQIETLYEPVEPPETKSDPNTPENKSQS